MTPELERGAKKVIRTLLEHGYEAYMVGGCVRDIQLNRTVKDYDIATSAKPEQVQRLFQRTIPTGLQHGTVSVIIGDFLYEVTTFRKESGYEDFRRPAEVEYIDSLIEDLRRRDFTMNAMAMDLEGKIIDPFQGVKDMENQLLRCVGDAGERFREDALRMLRCIRFAAEYGLEIERQTWLALLEQAPLLAHIAMERVRAELERMLSGDAPERAVGLLTDSRILAQVKQPLRLAALKREELAGGWGRLGDTPVKLAYLYLRIETGSADAENELKLLTFPKQLAEQVRLILAAANELSRQAEAAADEAALRQAWKLAAVTFGAPAIRAVRHILEADPLAMAEPGITAAQSSRLVERGLEWLNEMPVCSLDRLNLDGKQLLARINKPAGPWVSKVLAHLLREAALERVSNVKEDLLTEAERYMASSLQQESGSHEHK